MKNLGVYDNNLSTPRKQDVDERQEKIPVTAADNGMVMMVVDGRWTKGDAPSGTKVTQYSGTLLANSWAEDAYGYDL